MSHESYTWGVGPLARKAVADAVNASGQMLHRAVLVPEPQLDADVIGATTETLHASLPIPQHLLHTLNRTIRWRLTEQVQINATDDWTFRVRLGDAADLNGTIVTSIAALLAISDDVWVLEGMIKIRTLGVAGQYDSMAKMFGRIPAILSGFAGMDFDLALNTETESVLVVSAECDTNNAANQCNLRNFEYEVWEA